MLHKKNLRSLPSSKYEHIVCVIEKNKDLSTIAIEELVGTLQYHEHRMKQMEPTTTLRASFSDSSECF